MPRIVHLALKVENLEQATKFYENVFGFRQMKTGHARGHTSRHMTDGNIDLALMVYDSESEEEAQGRVERSEAQAQKLSLEASVAAADEVYRARRAAVDEQSTLVTELRVRAAQAKQKLESDRAVVERLGRSIDRPLADLWRVFCIVPGWAGEAGEARWTYESPFNACLESARIRLKEGS